MRRCHQTLCQIGWRQKRYCSVGIMCASFRPLVDACDKHRAFLAMPYFSVTSLCAVGTGASPQATGFGATAEGNVATTAACHPLPMLETLLVLLVHECWLFPGNGVAGAASRVSGTSAAVTERAAGCHPLPILEPRLVSLVPKCWLLLWRCCPWCGFFCLWHQCCSSRACC